MLITIFVLLHFIQERILQNSRVIMGTRSYTEIHIGTIKRSNLIIKTITDEWLIFFDHRFDTKAHQIQLLNYWIHQNVANPAR